MVNLLSNFLLRGDGPEERTFRCRLAGEADLRPAIRLVLGCEDEGQVEEFLLFAEERKIDLGALWVVEQRGRIVWSLLPVLNPGRTALLLSAHGGGGLRQGRAAGALIQQVCAYCAGKGSQMAQVLLDPHERSARQLYESCGFSLMAELEYLQMLVRRPAVPTLPVGMGWVTYSPAEHPRFAQTVLETYEESLDCPGLNGMRSIDDILAGHQAAGEFDPSLWFLLEEAGRILGMLLLSPTPRSDSIELVYLGLCPASRGRGLGDLLMRQAIWMTMRTGRSRLTLAVDAANPPALNLYYRHGLHRICSKVALMRDLRGGS